MTVCILDTKGERWRVVKCERRVKLGGWGLGTDKRFFLSPMLVNWPYNSFKQGQIQEFSRGGSCSGLKPGGVHYYIPLLKCSVDACKNH